MVSISGRPLPKKWHVLYVAFKHEKKVASRISDLNIESFLPLRKEIRMWGTRRKELEVPLFPQYLFVKESPKFLVPLLRINGVVKLVCFGNEYAIVQEDEIESIRLILAKDIEFKEETISFVKGKKVRIRRGAFEGVVGELYQKGGKSRFLIRIDSIAKGISVEVPVEWMEEVY